MARLGLATSLAFLSYRIVGVFSARPLVYFDQPEISWNARIGATDLDSLGKGNAVALAPDGRAMYVTSSNGLLTALNPNNGNPLGEFEPSPDPHPKGEGWTVRCESGVSFYADGDLAYLVYAVVDVPPPPERGGSPEVESSRIIAMNHTISGFGTTTASASLTEPRWTSEDIPGAISGTPAISLDGKYVFATSTKFPAVTLPPTTSPSNAPSTTPSSIPSMSPTPSNSTQGQTRRLEKVQRATADHVTVGYFSILADSKQGKVEFQEASTDKRGSIDSYGPVTIAHNVTRGMYSGGEGNNNDVVVWGSLPLDNPLEGDSHLFQFPKNFDGQDFDSLETIHLESVSWSTTTAPTITKSGLKLFYAASQNKLHGWTDGRPFDLVPNFLADMGANLDAPEDAPYNSAVLSVDEDIIFLGSTQASFYAVNASDSNNVWVDLNLDFTVQAKAQVSPDGLRVYFPSGTKLFAKNAADGSDLWNPPFEHTEGEIGDISSEFAVSADGLNLYYCSDGARRITGLKLADPPPPTTFPSAMPSGETSAVPSSVPSTSSMPSGSSAPTLSGSPSSTPSVSPSSLPTSTLSSVPSTSSLPSASPSRVIVPPTNRPTPSPTGAPTTDDGVSTGLIIGVSVAGAVVLVGAAYALWRFVLKNGGGGEDGIDPNFVEGGGGGGGGYGDEEDEGPLRRPDYADPATRDWVN